MALPWGAQSMGLIAPHTHAHTPTLLTNPGAAGATAAAASVPPLLAFARRNTESLGRLFLEFLWQFAFEVDPRTAVVAVNNIDDEGEAPRAPVVRRSFTKLRARKAALSHWRMGSALAIEDPFERDYDVAHVLRPQVRRAMGGEGGRRCAGRREGRAIRGGERGRAGLRRGGGGLPLARVPRRIHACAAPPSSLPSPSPGAQEWRTLRLELGLAYATLAAAVPQGASPADAAAAAEAAVAAVFAAQPAPPASVAPEKSRRGPHSSSGPRRAGTDAVAGGYDDEEEDDDGDAFVGEGADGAGAFFDDYAEGGGGSSRVAQAFPPGRMPVQGGAGAGPAPPAAAGPPGRWRGGGALPPRGGGGGVEPLPRSSSGFRGPSLPPYPDFSAPTHYDERGGGGGSGRGQQQSSWRGSSQAASSGDGPPPWRGGGPARRGHSSDEWQQAPHGGFGGHPHAPQYQPSSQPLPAQAYSVTFSDGGSAWSATAPPAGVDAVAWAVDPAASSSSSRGGSGGPPGYAPLPPAGRGSAPYGPPPHHVPSQSFEYSGGGGGGGRAAGSGAPHAMGYSYGPPAYAAAPLPQQQQQQAPAGYYDSPPPHQLHAGGGGGYHPFPFQAFPPEQQQQQQQQQQYWGAGAGGGGFVPVPGQGGGPPGMHAPPYAPAVAMGGAPQEQQQWFGHPQMQEQWGW